MLDNKWYIEYWTSLLRGLSQHGIWEKGYKDGNWTPGPRTLYNKEAPHIMRAELHAARTRAREKS